jgi:hypothetical protein
MFRFAYALIASLALALTLSAPSADADIVLDWNQTIHDMMQADGAHPANSANPGWATRSIAMMNTAIYDAFQAVNRTHQPFLFTQRAEANTDLYAAVNEAAYQVLQHCYPGELTGLEAAYDARMAMIPAGAGKDHGISLGQLIAQECVNDRTSDGSDPGSWTPYVLEDGAGKWRPQPGQSAWGPGWGTVNSFGVPGGTIQSYISDLPPIPSLTNQDYTDAFDQVKSFGAINSATRTEEMLDTGLFWAYDRATMGPPPVLFLRSLKEIAHQIGTPEDVNARLFAMTSVAQADAAIAAWDAKFEHNFWRPIGAIQGDRLDGSKGHDDGNPSTTEDIAWLPYGAPDGTPGPSSGDFTPPFPAWTSGHATMGGAVFKSLELFFGNDFAAADAAYGSDLATAFFTLNSAEFDSAGALGMSRDYEAFTEDLDNWGIGKEGQESTPEGENAMSRIYLGIHWIFDQRDGTVLGRRLAEYVAANMFQAVPEPSSLALLAAVAAAALARRVPRRSAA